VLLSAPRFALPETVAEAVAALAERPGAALVAGGTELMPDLLWRRRAVAGLVSLRRIPALRTVTVDRGTLRVGSGVTAERLEGPDVLAAAPGLARAAASLGTPQVRTEATAGGNVVSALPYRNLLPVLLALDATLELSGGRDVPFDGFVTGPGRTRLAPGEVLVGLRVPVRPGHQDYVKIGRRNAQYVATVSAALVLDTAARSARLAFGNAAPVPLRLPEADRVATGAVDWATGTVSAAGAAEVAEVVRRGVDPPADEVASADYRRHALGVLTARLLTRAGIPDG
jgi:CO/xanthine dehydrogenase FAD-binding subunit